MLSATRLPSLSQTGTDEGSRNRALRSHRPRQAQDAHPGPARQDHRQRLHRGRGAGRGRQGRRAARPLRPVADRRRDARGALRAAGIETHRKKRIPLDDCIGAIADFCDCRVWREKNAAGEARYVFFGLRSDIEVAHYLTELIDAAVRAELGRYKTTPDYRRFRHQERHMANASFALGMVASIADKLMAMKAARDEVNHRTGRDLVVVKAAVVDSRTRQTRPEAADGARRRPDGVAHGLRSRRDGRRFARHKPRHPQGLKRRRRPPFELLRAESPDFV